MTNEERAKLVEQLRDEDSYYRIQESHWCIDSDELERQRQTAADQIEADGQRIAELEAALRNTKWLLEGIKRAGYVTKPSYGDEINLGLERTRAALGGNEMTEYGKAEQRINEALTSFYDRGCMEERAAIVAWLRRYGLSVHYQVAADEIEAGEHLK